MDAVTVEFYKNDLSVYESHKAIETYHSSWMIINLVSITKEEVYESSRLWKCSIAHNWNKMLHLSKNFLPLTHADKLLIISTRIMGTMVFLGSPSL